MAPRGPIPITVITGFLGSGKTTLILNLIPQLPKDYRLALLKNEFGDVAVDSELAASSAISGVQELLNGCICCNLVGQLSDALEALRNQVTPDRIVIETSGSAFPATLAMEVNRLARETGAYLLDGVISVIDVENWKGYDDTSYTAKIQAQYTDLIVMNKWELVSERQLEDCEDRILDLGVDPPTPRTKSNKGYVDKELIFGLDAGLSKEVSLQAEHSHINHGHAHDHQSEVEVLSVVVSGPGGQRVGIDTKKLETLLSQATKDEIYRIKGVLLSAVSPSSSTEAQNQPAEERSAKRMRPAEPSRYILNWAFGRWTYTEIGGDSSSSTPFGSGTSTPMLQAEEPVARLTIITARYEANKWQKFIQNGDFFALADGSSANLSVERTA